MKVKVTCTRDALNGSTWDKLGIRVLHVYMHVQLSKTERF